MLFKDFLSFISQKKSNLIVSMLKVDGLNVDTLPVSEQEGLNEDFGVFHSKRSI